ncbi:hypothetical protein APS47_14700 [Leptospira kirschneri serovar Mozdok]|nr:hypothetical protein APS47_14700 [Leptospira kirschneri serovar Mozdok]
MKRYYKFLDKLLFRNRILDILLELLKNSIVKISKIASQLSIQSNTNRSRINFSTTLLFNFKQKRLFLFKKFPLKRKDSIFYFLRNLNKINF